MPGSGNQNEIIYAKNADFSGSSVPAGANGINLDNQIWLGRSASVAGLSQIDVMTLTAGTGMQFVRAGAGVPGTPGSLTLNNTGSLTDYHDTRFIVSAGGAANGANYTTIASAITAASSAGGVQDVFIQPGSYTENLTWPANINLVAHVGDANTPTVTIIGKLTCTDAGTRTASGIRFQTNSDNILSITGSAATIVEFHKCYFNASNASAFVSTTSSTSSRIRCFDCSGNLGTTGIAYFSIDHGSISLKRCTLENSGSSVTQSVCANDAFFDIEYTRMENAISHTSSSTSTIYWSYYRMGGLAVVPLTTSGTGLVLCKFTRFESQAQSSISIGSGTTVSIDQCSIDSSASSTITGAGTAIIGDITYTSTSQGVSTGLTRTNIPHSNTKLVFLSSQTASSSSSISFTSVISSLYSSYMLVITALQPATNTANLQLLFSANNGSSYLASNYLSGTLYTAITGTTFSNANSTADVRLSGPISSSGFFTGNYILTGFNTAGFGYVNGKSTWNDTTLTAYSNATTAGLNNGTTAINAIRLIMSSGNITAGTFTLYGIRENIS